MILRIKVLHFSAICFVIILCKAGEPIGVEIQEPQVKNVPYLPEGNVTEASGNDMPQGRISYSGSQLWNVEVDNEEKMALIKEVEENGHLSTWSGNKTHVDIFVKRECIKEVSEKFEKLGIKYEVVNENMQKAIDEENPAVGEDIDELQDRRGHRLTWTTYHRLADIDTFLDYLATSYPSICKLQTIGRSVEGRPLRLLKISNGRRGNKAIWIDGGIHAREWISPATTTYIINNIVENFENDELFHNIDWHIIPVVNPDGYEFTHTDDRFWRKNRSKRTQCAGVDLNRNFGYRWGGKGASHYPCQEIYAGASAFSEPESSAIQNYITNIQRGAAWKGYITFHSYGQYILFPWGYDATYTPDHNDLKNVAHKMAVAMRSTSGANYRAGTSATLLYPASGGSDDWAKGGAGIKYTYTIELRDTGSYGFALPAKYIIPTATEALAAVKVIAGAVVAL